MTIKTLIANLNSCSEPGLVAANCDRGSILKELSGVIDVSAIAIRAACHARTSGIELPRANPHIMGLTENND